MPTAGLCSRAEISATSIRSVRLMTAELIVIGMERLSSVSASWRVGRTVSFSRCTGSPRRRVIPACTSI